MHDGTTTAPRVLLLDSRTERRNVMRIVVETGGQAAQVVAEASSADEAVAAVDRHQVEVAVVEIQMPVTVGLAAIATLRAAHPTLPIVVCSFRNDLGTQLDAAAAGASAYLAKPPVARDLQAAIRRPQPAATELARALVDADR